MVFVASQQWLMKRATIITYFLWWSAYYAMLICPVLILCDHIWFQQPQRGVRTSLLSQPLHYMSRIFSI